MNTLSNETCLNVKHQCFIFQNIIQIYLNTYTIYKHVSECLLQSTMLAAVQATDEQLIMIAPLYLMWISAHPANFLHQTCIAGHVKHLSQYNGRISEWMAFGQTPFTHRKRIKNDVLYGMLLMVQSQYLSFTNDPHSDFIVIKLTASTLN